MCLSLVLEGVCLWFRRMYAFGSLGCLPLVLGGVSASGSKGVSASGSRGFLPLVLEGVCLWFWGKIRAKCSVGCGFTLFKLLQSEYYVTQWMTRNPLNSLNIHKHRPICRVLPLVFDLRRRQVIVSPAHHPASGAYTQTGKMSILRHLPIIG